MGIVKAAFDALGGGLADQWLEVIEPQSMSDSTVMTYGVKVRAGDVRNDNFKGTNNTVSDGSIIHVYPNQFMILVDGGKIIDYTAEAGYYKVSNSTFPSLFNGQFGDALKETFNRVKFAGVPSTAQKVYYINLQEVKGIKFGTRSPINYFDNFYNAELFLKAHGSYSIKIVEPLKFFTEAIPRNKVQVDINDINEQYLSEFLTALQSVVNQMSADGIRISLVASKSMELAKYMADVLDSDWSQMRGMQIQSVGISSLSYDEESRKLIDMRNQGAMLQDARIREGYVQGSIARGLEAAGSNEGGVMTGFMGVGMGMQSAGNFVNAVSQTNLYQMQQQSGMAKPKDQQDSWKCKCGAVNSSKFCEECGMKKPEDISNYRCNKCGFEPPSDKPLPKFCPECGDPFNEEDRK